jgi:hypothetical protein
MRGVLKRKRKEGLEGSQAEADDISSIIRFKPD